MRNGIQPDRNTPLLHAATRRQTISTDNFYSRLACRRFGLTQANRKPLMPPRTTARWADWALARENATIICIVWTHVKISSSWQLSFRRWLRKTLRNIGQLLRRDACFRRLERLCSFRGKAIRTLVVNWRRRDTGFESIGKRCSIRQRA